MGRLDLPAVSPEWNHIGQSMTEAQTLLVTTMREIRQVLADMAVEAVELNPEQNADQFPRRDLEQMVEGTFVAMEEFFKGDARPYWDDYLETVIPGIVAVGFRLTTVLHTVSSFFCLSAIELDRRLAADPLRDAVRTEFVRFSSSWQQAIMSVPTK